MRDVDVILVGSEIIWLNPSRITNVRIYVEQAIGRLKQFHILKNILPINYLPLCDDIVQVMCALTSFQDPHSVFEQQWLQCSLPCG